MNTLCPVVMTALLVSGCVATPAVISDINDSSLKVEGGMGTTDAMIQSKAAEGCALYSKRAVSISQQCMDQYCLRRRVLFACK